MKTILKRTAMGIVLFFAIIILYLLLWPVKIDPAAWTPPAAPELSGVFTENNLLSGVEKLAGGYYGPEAIAIGNDGYLYTGLLSDGRILRISPDGKIIEVFAQAKEPAGMKFDAGGNLIVADATMGLLLVDRNGTVSILTNQVDGVPINFADDLAIASDGKIFFSDASTKFPNSEFMADLFEHRPNGRLLVFDPLTGITSVLLEELYFSNGVTIEPDENYLLFCETSKYRVQRYWLKGDQAGQVDVFIDNLPGFPDNITFNGTDTYWLALAAGPKSRAATDPILPKPFLRKILWRLRGLMSDSGPGEGYILGLDLNGNVKYNLQDPDGEFYPNTTSAIEANGILYLGSHMNDGIGKIPIPKNTR
ncbi:MAG: SMP-30/gluconolactonase/LRE family protein [Bacteroidetes bacterium]|nr:MAG: SMP-30/gluconolactonase/LRE family protein [Bacteroidota bacterium]